MKFFSRRGIIKAAAPRVSTKEADEHLLEIRASKGLDPNSQVPQAIINDLESAAKVLSDQLYQKSAHFLLELIQNADDNRYEASEPTIHLTYTKNHLRVDCNELGFSAKDIDAICSIGRSSKTGSGASTKYVGEKGIGFKSVFKACDVVWISSGAYEFKFDRNQRLGMIAPIIEKFPQPRKDGWTSFYLQLSKSYNNDEIISDLQALDAKMLIFLRRLRKIVVTISRPRSPSTTKILTRSEDRIDGNEAIHLVQDQTRLSYIIMRHTARKLPSDERRPGVSDSELLIALPVDANMEPQVDTQQVFAFLPIRDYGFKFLIQGDFLLIASREDVDNSAKWNQKLRDEVAVAFLQCIKWFNSGRLKYSWPRYLPGKPTSGDFFDPLKDDIFSRISNQPTLEAWNGQITPASKLMYIPAKYTDPAGVPLTLTTTKQKSYLSRGYCADDYDNLKLIGVSEMGDSEFLDHLEESLKQSLQDFKSKSPEWHSRLAAVLSEILETTQIEPEKRVKNPIKAAMKGEIKSPKAIKDQAIRRAFRERILKLPLIALRNGDWVCAEGNQVFFPGDSERWEIPGGIDILVADPKVVSDLSRAHLFRILGVEDFKPFAINEMIVDCLSYETTKAFKVSRHDVISQTRFLYSTGWRNSSERQFWLVSESDSRALSSTLYFDDSNEPHSATKYFANYRKEAEFIHPEYYTKYPQDSEAWRSWLETNMSISKIPRIYLNVREASPKNWVFHMSPDFELIIRHWSYLDVLMLICDKWQTYSRWIKYTPSPDPNTQQSDLDPAVETSYTTLRNRIRSISVKCKNGTFTKLEDTYLLQEAPMSTCSASLLDVPDPEHSRWQHLEEFGVGMRQDIGFYLQSLQSVSGNPCDLKQVTYLYEQIQAHCNSNESRTTVRNFFQEKGSLVHILPDLDCTPNMGFWVPTHQCLWNGPKNLKAHFSLKDLYPSCERLFSDILEISDAKMTHIVFEAAYIKQSDGMGFIRDIFMEMQKFLEKDEANKEKLDSLDNKWIWPVSQEKEPKAYAKLSSTSKEWFIADTRDLRQSFAGLVPLLNFEVEDIHRMRLLLSCLKLDGRRLTNAAISTPKSSGLVVVDAAQTELFWTRYEFFLRLLPPPIIQRKERKKVVNMLQKVNVYTAERIIQRYIVKFSGNTIEGRQKEGKVALAPERNSLDIHVVRNYFQLGTPWELVEGLASLMKVDHHRDGKHLLQIALTNPPDRIREAFDRFGVPEAYPDDDCGEYDEDEDEEQFASQLKQPNQLNSRSGSRIFYTYFSKKIRLITSTSMDSGDNDEDEGDGQSPPAYELIYPQIGGDEEDIDASLAFIGEEFISKKLAESMGDKFIPEEHWTSSLRVKAGLSPIPDTKGASAFTIKDTYGIWTAIMADLGYENARAWQHKPPTWHIEVRTTKGPHRDQFTFSQRRLDMSRKYTVPPTGRVHAPANVMVLIRVFNAGKKPDCDVLVDPWALYVMGKIRLQSSGGYHGHVVV